MITERDDKGEPQKRLRRYNFKSWILLTHYGNGYSVVNADSLKNICREWRTWKKLLEISIEPCAELDEKVVLYSGLNTL